MPRGFVYPTKETIIFTNEIINIMSNRKADHGLITTHGFASGNKRTGFITTVRFLIRNRGKVRIKNFNKAERIITNIRVLGPKEIATWLRKGDIDETKIQ